MKVLRALLSRWVLSFVGVALLALLVWLFGPLLSAFELWLPRLLIVLALLIVWAAANLLLDWRRRGRQRALEAGLTAAPTDNADPALVEEQAALAEKLRGALALLKKARGTRGYLYEQPWYAIIGPPGAGKTTALLNAGLKFPLAAEMGQGAVAGIGGTRLCEWWFTETAVLIDTAGRYTTQDSNASVDRAGWEAFLGLLKRTRPRQPLNGVIVAIALSEIAQAPAEERVAHARAVRRRVKELEEKLGIRIPVYALFTKADLIAGFSEFFDDLDREKRGQVWGATFPLAKARVVEGAASTVEGFAAELRLLVERLDERLFDRLQAERSPERRALIAGFPMQVATLEQPLMAFLTEAFGGSRLDPAPLLRGAYLASGTQEGTPIDRLTGAMARSFGLDQRRAPSLRPERGRSYFLERLLSGVIFGEAMLVSEPPGAARRRVAVRVASFAAVFLLVLGAGGALFASRLSGQQQIDAMAGALAGYEKTANGLPLDPVGDADLPRLVPLLDTAHSLAQQAAAGSAGFGLSQEAKLQAGAQAVYRHALGYALLPRMVWRLEAQMRGNITHPDFLYEATRVYLMLGGEGPLDRALVREWMTLDWQATYPGAFNGPMLASLGRHLDALLAEPLPPVLLDGALVAQARATFSRVPVAARVYSRIKPSAAAQRVPPWRPNEALGAAGLGVFMRASGKPLSDGVPGFLTLAGFHGVLLPALPGAVHEVASESWVLGKNAEVNLSGLELQKLEQAVVLLYEADYIQAWDAVLQDLNVVALRSLTQAAQDLYILSSPQSPMKDLLGSVARQVTLSKPPPPAPGVAGAVADLAGKAQAAVAGAAVGENSRVSALLGGQPGTAPALPPGHEIDERYQPLRDLVGTGAGAPLDQVLKSLNDLQQQLAKMAAAPLGAAPAPAATGNDPAMALRAEAQRQPQPLARWLLAMSGSGTVLRGGGARQQVAAAYNGASGPAALCPVAVNGRFPFVPASTLETPVEDFAKLFAPGGLIDGFFNTQLRPYVDTSGAVWKPQPADGVAAPVSPADLAQFQRAAGIRDLFFAAGSTTPAVRFDITPAKLDDNATQVTLDFDGTAVTYSHGPPRATQITWPGPTRMQNVRLVFEPPPSGGTGVLSDAGPWAMFRMFNRGTLKQAGSPERYALAFQLGERQASFEIRAGSVLNPFAPGLLQDFHCPVVQ